MKRSIVVVSLFFFGVAGAQATQRMTDFAPADRPPVEKEVAEAPVIPAGIPDGMHLLEGPRRLILHNLNVGILIADDAAEAQAVVDVLLASGHVLSVDVIRIDNSTPTLPDIEAYDAVICWTNLAPLDPVALGDLLADYIDLGKGVVACEGAFTVSWGLQGRFMAEYSPFTTSDDGFVGVSLGTYDPDHPLMTDVSAVTGYYAFNLGPTVNAACVAWWNNDWPFVAYNIANNKVVGINACPGASALWTGDLLQVVLNSVLFVTADMPEACQLSKYELGNPWYNSNWHPGDRAVTFFDPIDCPGTTTYPFDITSLDFQLHVYAGSYPVDVDIVVFDMLDPDDECQGPGAELYRFSYSCDESFQFPNVGTAPFPEPCCVEGQFFIGIEYWDPVEASIICDSNYPVYCENWVVYQGSDWRDWTDVSGLGYFAFWINGETNLPDCQQDIPTLSEWGAIILSLLLLVAGTIAIVRRQQATTTVHQPHCRI